MSGGLTIPSAATKSSDDPGEVLEAAAECFRLYIAVSLDSEAKVQSQAVNDSKQA